MGKRGRCLLVGVMSLLVLSVPLLCTGQAQSQDRYPSRPISIILPVAPGGALEVSLRIVTVPLSKKWGVPVNIISKPGGNSVPATMEVYESKPDGYTLFGDAQSSSSMMEIAMKNLPFKVMDRTFVFMGAQCPMVFAVSSKSTVKGMKEVENDAKKDPENFTWASLGGAGMQDLGTRQFLKAIGVDVWKTKPIMFRGGAPAVAATAGGNVKLGSGTTTAMLPAYKAGSVRPLGITSTGKHPDYPDTPTMAELGYPTVTCTWWMGITGPPKLPSAIVDKWNKVMREILEDPDVISKLKRAGSTPYYLNASDFKKYVVAETAEVTKLWVK